MKKKLLIHHHAVAFRSDEKVYLQSFIGAWIKELKNFYEVGMLMQESATKLPNQDFELNGGEYNFHSLGQVGQGSRIWRNKQIKDICAKVSLEYDILLIRGITPKQKLISESCRINKRFFLLVGSIIDSKPKFKISKVGIITWAFYWKRLYELKSISRVSNVFANSPKIVNELKRVMKINAKFIPTNTITQNDFVSFCVKQISKNPKLLFCGRVVDAKGIEELLIALVKLKDKQIICKLTIVGKVDSSYKEKLQEFIGINGISSQVCFAGYISFGEKLLDYYRQSDIYVLPSWHEGFPHSIWEAAASCTPIVVTKVGGISGIISEDEVIFIEAKNPNSIVNAIISLINDKNKVAQITTAAYSLSTRYTVEMCAKKLFEEIEQV